MQITDIWWTKKTHTHVNWSTFCPHESHFLLFYFIFNIATERITTIAIRYKRAAKLSQNYGSPNRNLFTKHVELTDVHFPYVSLWFGSIYYKIHFTCSWWQRRTANGSTIVKLFYFDLLVFSICYMLSCVIILSVYLSIYLSYSQLQIRNPTQKNELFSHDWLPEVRVKITFFEFKSHK